MNERPAVPSGYDAAPSPGGVPVRPRPRRGTGTIRARCSAVAGRAIRISDHFGYEDTRAGYWGSPSSGCTGATTARPAISWRNIDRYSTVEAKLVGIAALGPAPEPDAGGVVYSTAEVGTGTLPTTATLPLAAERVDDDLFAAERVDDDLFAAERVDDDLFAAERVDDNLLAAVQADSALRSRLVQAVFGADATWACSTETLLTRGESPVVEYMQTALCHTREQRRDETKAQAVATTVAGMLNSRGGTLLIGVTDNGTPIGLEDDYARVSPPNAEVYVNWLSTLFKRSLGPAGVRRLSIRIDRIGQYDICRIDVPASSRPIRVNDSTDVSTGHGSGILYQRREGCQHPGTGTENAGHGSGILYQRREGSTRPVPPAEVEQFIAERFRSQPSPMRAPKP